MSLYRNAIVFKKAKTGFPMDIYMLPPRAPTASKSDPNSFAGETPVVPYFFVGTTDKKQEANMIETILIKRGIEVPVLHNTKELEPHTRLLRYKPSSGKSTTASIQSTWLGVVGEPSASAPPAKKAKAGGKV